jgi:hypothetical protein
MPLRPAVGKRSGRRWGGGTSPPAQDPEQLGPDVQMEGKFGTVGWGYQRAQGG